MFADYNLRRNPERVKPSVNMCSVRIRVLFFGVIRDVVGLREDTLDIAEGGSLGSVFEHYSGRYPRLREVAASSALPLTAHFSPPAAPLPHCRHPPLLPPLTGGPRPPPPPA